ncbi:unnamed protein product [Spirodela intermedia]|uniref:ARM repeat N-terminal plant domain-containing protein n=1 Tax=Spirodela intermedia TaxID=51605 RepID=A0ABN7EBE6_SPIIN|nr:unnamed protein product [Spirodela intermedia]
MSYPGCFFCVMKEGNPNKRRSSIIKFFRELPSQDDDGQVLPISGLWNTAMSHPNDPEFIDLGILNASKVAVRALGHLATYASTFPAVASHGKFWSFPFMEMESRKAEEWASQLQCWSLQLINCFAFKQEFLSVINKVTPVLVDLAEISTLGDNKKLGDMIVCVLQECIQTLGTGHSSIGATLKWEKKVPKEDLHIKQAATLVVKLEGNSLFSSGNIAGAALKYTEALTLCPMRSKKNELFCTVIELSAIFSCSNPLQPLAMPLGIVCPQPPNRHAKACGEEPRLMTCLDCPRRACWTLYYLSTSVKKQMRAAWLFREAAEKHGVCDREADDSEWETASESDIGNDDREEKSNEVN